MNGVYREDTLVGWGSWYHYYTQCDENEIRLNSDFFRTQRPTEVEWIGIDDGYQKTVGDWEENSRFGGGLKSLVKEIHERKMRAGIWIAPFIASERSEVFKDKPEWFLRDDDNKPIVVGQNPLWLGNYYAFDLTNMRVIEHIKHIFKKFRECGFEYYKIDFLHHVSVEGFRQDMKITRAQSYRMGLEAIREIVGDGLILGSGAILGPSVGIIDVMRVGTDIAPTWKYEWGGGVYESSINTMNRAIMHNRLWANNPDCVLVRQADNEINIEEVKLWLNIVALSGGPVFLGDRMMDLSEERLDLLDKIIPPFGESGIALDSLEKTEPSIFALHIRTGIGTWLVAALVNLTEEPLDISFSLSRFGFEDDDMFHVFDFWNQEYHGVTEKEVNVFGLKPHSSKLLLVRPQIIEPTVLSTSIHFTQGAKELSDLIWNHTTGELTVKMTKDVRKPESLFFVFGEDWIPVHAYVDEEKVTLEQIAPEVVAVKHKFTKGNIVKIKFRQ